MLPVTLSISDAIIVPKSVARQTTANAQGRSHSPNDYGTSQTHGTPPRVVFRSLRV